MLIATYRSENAPPAHAWVAVFYVNEKPASRLPMAFFGHDEMTAIYTAKKWLEDEQAKERKKAENAEAFKARRKKVRGHTSAEAEADYIPGVKNAYGED